MIDTDETLHAELVKAFHEYYKAHQEWRVKGTRRAGMDARNRLLDIRHIAKAYRKVIMDWRYAVDSDKRQKKAQNKEDIELDDDN